MAEEPNLIVIGPSSNLMSDDTTSASNNGIHQSHADTNNNSNTNYNDNDNVIGYGESNPVSSLSYNYNNQTESEGIKAAPESPRSLKKEDHQVTIPAAVRSSVSTEDPNYTIIVGRKSQIQSTEIKGDEEEGEEQSQEVDLFTALLEVGRTASSPTKDTASPMSPTGSGESSGVRKSTSKMSRSEVTGGSSGSLNSNSSSDFKSTMKRFFRRPPKSGSSGNTLQSLSKSFSSNLQSDSNIAISVTPSPSTCLDENSEEAINNPGTLDARSGLADFKRKISIRDRFNTMTSRPAVINTASNNNNNNSILTPVNNTITPQGDSPNNLSGVSAKTSPASSNIVSTPLGNSPQEIKRSASLQQNSKHKSKSQTLSASNSYGIISLLSKSPSGELGLVEETSPSKSPANMPNQPRLYDASDYLNKTQNVSFHISMELLATERNYLTALNIIIDEYFRPIQESLQKGSTNSLNEKPILSKVDSKILFAVIPELINFTAELIKDLEQAMKEYQEEEESREMHAASKETGLPSKASPVRSASIGVIEDQKSNLSVNTMDAPKIEMAIAYSSMSLNDKFSQSQELEVIKATSSCNNEINEKSTSVPLTGDAADNNNSAMSEPILSKSQYSVATSNEVGLGAVSSNENNEMFPASANLTPYASGPNLKKESVGDESEHFMAESIDSVKASNVANLGYLGKIALIFQTRLDNGSFQIYMKFVDNYAAAKSALIRNLENNPGFKQFLSDKKSRRETLRQGLDDLLIIPVQRIARYVLLLSDLKKRCQEDSIDYPLIARVVEGVKQLANSVNEVKRREEEMTRLFEVQKAISGCPPTIISATRRVIMESVSVDSTQKGKAYKVVLLNDMLIIAKGHYKGSISKVKHTGLTVSPTNNSINAMVSEEEDFPQSVTSEISSNSGHHNYNHSSPLFSIDLTNASWKFLHLSSLKDTMLETLSDESLGHGLRLHFAMNVGGSYNLLFPSRKEKMELFIAFNNQQRRTQGSNGSNGSTFASSIASNTLSIMSPPN